MRGVPVRVVGARADLVVRVVVGQPARHTGQSRAELLAIHLRVAAVGAQRSGNRDAEYRGEKLAKNLDHCTSTLARKVKIRTLQKTKHAAPRTVSVFKGASILAPATRRTKVQENTGIPGG